MFCPKCHHPDTKVIDTRLGKGNQSIRRRRQCLECSARFTTIEEVLRDELFIIKRDGSREGFDRNKLIAGIRKATERRPIQMEQIEMMLSNVVDQLERIYDNEVPSKAIGEKIMEHLKQMDKVAYIRYASVYKEFKDIDEFQSTIAELNQ